jgi:phosphoenolpyruvate synthase/pyruvate phosphate dikinase
MGEDCATGVAFTRNPSTGENAFYGEYLVNGNRSHPRCQAAAGRG